MNKSKRKNKITGEREKQLSSHLFGKDRWVLTQPDSPEILPKVFLSESKAMSVANGIAGKQRVNVEISHERIDASGNWAEVL